jgi:hypothetical protein
MMLGKLNLFGFREKEKVAIATDIDLKFFVDFYLDTVGWFAIGHHEPEKFLAAILEKDPNARFAIGQVQLTWAKFPDDERNDIEVTKEPVVGSQAITLVEDWGKCDCECGID